MLRKITNFEPPPARSLSHPLAVRSRPRRKPISFQSIREIVEKYEDASRRNAFTEKYFWAHVLVEKGEPYLIERLDAAGAISQAELKSAQKRAAIVLSEQGASDQQVARKVGGILIQSLPIECTVEIQALGVNHDKKKDEMRLDDVPEGEYIATFRAAGRTLQGSFAVKENTVTHVFANVVGDRFEIRSSTPTSEAAERIALGGEAENVQAALPNVLGVATGTALLGTKLRTRARLNHRLSPPVNQVRLEVRLRRQS